MNGTLLPTGATAREAEWRRPLAALMLAYLAFETLTGLVIYLLPFSVGNQWTVILHTAIGLLVLAPALVYQVRHLRVYWERPMSALKAMGYLSTASTLVALVSGVVLTWQAVAGTRIGYGWDMTHIVSTFALIAFVAPHVLVILVRDRAVSRKSETAGLLAAQRVAMAKAAGWFAAFGALVWIA